MSIVTAGVGGDKVFLMNQAGGTNREKQSHRYQEFQTHDPTRTNQLIILPPVQIVRVFFINIIPSICK